MREFETYEFTIGRHSKKWRKGGELRIVIRKFPIVRSSDFPYFRSNGSDFSMSFSSIDTGTLQVQ